MSHNLVNRILHADPKTITARQLSEWANAIEALRDKIKELRQYNDNCNQAINELYLVNAFESVLKEDNMAIRSVKCKATEPYVERAPVGEFTWYVYNIHSGHIVAATYSEDMAKTILNGIGAQPTMYKDPYAICELYRPPEPLV